MTTDGACHRRNLAEQGPFRVDLCQCGAVHVTVGFTTVRLELAAYHELCLALLEARRTLIQCAARELQ